MRLKNCRFQIFHSFRKMKDFYAYLTEKNLIKRFRGLCRFKNHSMANSKLMFLTETTRQRE